MQTKLYLAYGSNLNLRQMAHRCPGAELLGYTYLEDTRLIYRGSLSGYYLSIEPARGSRTPCGVFRITPQDERSLDRYEGYPELYGKVIYRGLPLYAMDGTRRPGTIDAMAYQLPVRPPPGCRSRTTSASAPRAIGISGLILPISIRLLPPPRRKFKNDDYYAG